MPLANVSDAAFRARACSPRPGPSVGRVMVYVIVTWLESGHSPAAPWCALPCLQESRALGQGLCNHAPRSQWCVPETCTRCTEGAYQRHVPSVPGCVPGTCTKGVYQILPLHVPDLPLYCHGKSGTCNGKTWYVPLVHVPGMHPATSGTCHWYLVVHLGVRCSCRLCCRWLRLGEGSRAARAHGGCGSGPCINQQVLKQATRLLQQKIPNPAMTIGRANDLCKAKQVHIYLKEQPGLRMPKRNLPRSI